MADKVETGKDALVYEPSAVSWAVAEAVARPPAVLARIGLYLIALIVGASVIYAKLAKISITVQGQGIIRTSGKVRPVRASTTGKLAQLHVANGKRVTKDQTLVEMEDMLDQREQTRAKDLVTKVKTLLDKGGDSRSSMADVGVLAQEPLRMSGPVLVRERTSLAEALNGYYQALRTLYDATPELTRADASERQSAESKIAKIKQQHLENELRNELQDLEKSVGRLSVAIRDRQEQARRGVSSARTTLEVQVRTFEEGLRTQTENLHITAPVDGVVSGLAVSGAGELIQSGQTLFQIIPDGGRLIAEVKIANKDIAELKLGMPVQLKLDAYAFQDYGALNGKLTEIPADSTEVDKGAMYVVQVTPDREALELNGHSYPVKLGMTLSADVEVRRRTLLDLAIVEVLKLKSSL
jgi:multidrug efflux pump subunit AcrA (membrane-fusion protein)